MTSVPCRLTPRVRARAFSLVEVTLAIGIMGFAFVSILGLMPVGLNTFRETKNVSVASQIAQQIFAEVQSTPFAQLTGVVPSGQPSGRLPPPSSQTQTDPSASQGLSTPLRCFDETGQELSPTDPKVAPNIVYRVNVRVAPSPPYVQNATATAAATPPPNPALANITIQIAYNPGNLSMDTANTPDYATADPYLWTGKSHGAIVPMVTYETLVARNF